MRKLMGMFDDVQVGGASENSTKQESGKKKEKTKYWLNVGLSRGDKFLSLPLGIPLDDLKAKPVPNSGSKNQDFRNLRIGEAQLWTKIEEIKSTLKPGESKKLQLEVELRHVAEAQQVTDEEVETNPYGIGDCKLVAA